MTGGLNACASLVQAVHAEAAAQQELLLALLCACCLVLLLALSALVMARHRGPQEGLDAGDTYIHLTAHRAFCHGVAPASEGRPALPASRPRVRAGRAPAQMLKPSYDGRRHAGAGNSGQG